MATPEAEETVAAPATAEDVVKAAKEGEKEAPKETVKEAPKAETEEKTDEVPVSAEPGNADEAAAVEEPAVPFKEESNLVSDLKDSEKKALEEFRARIVKAIEDKEFKVPKKTVEAPKEAAAVETSPKEADADKPTEAAAVESTPKEAEAEKPKEEVKEATAEPAAAEPEKAEPEKATAPTGEESSSTAPKEEEKEAVSEAQAPPAAVAPKEESKAGSLASAVKEAFVGKPKEEEKEAPPSEAEKPTEKAEESVPPEAEKPKEEVKETAAEPEKPTAATTEESSSKEVEPKEAPAAAPGEGAAAVEEEPEDPTPAEDVAFWGVPLLHTKGDPRTDVILLKFLRAREFNVSQSFEQLKKAIIWRKTFKADGLVDEQFDPDLDQVSFYRGVDKEGHPICYNVYSPFSQNKDLYAKTFGDSAKTASFIRWRIQVLEKGIKLLNFSPEGPNAMVQIADVKSFPVATGSKVKSAYSQAVNLLQDNYPELVVKQVFVNAPWNFRAYYVFMKMNPFTSARTKSKFSIYPPGKTTEALLKFIPGEALPVAYGGLSKPNDPDFDGVTAPAAEQVVKSGESGVIEISVTESGGTVVWDLAVGGYEVTYGAEYVPSAEGAYTTIIEKPKKLPASQEEPLRSSFKISAPGKVVITIDNSSRKKKIVVYRYTVKSSSSLASEAAGSVQPKSW